MCEVHTICRTIIKELSDQNAKTVLDLNNKLTEKDALYEQLLLSKKNAENEREPKIAKVTAIKEPNDKLHGKVNQPMEEKKKDESVVGEGKKPLKRKLIRSPSMVENSQRKLLRTSKPTPGLNKSRQKQFAVERILAHKTDDNQKIFLIRWEDYGEKHDSWLPESDLFCPQILEEYKKNHSLI